MYNTYPQNNGPYYNGYKGYAPQQPMPVAAPVAQSSSANMGLLVVAGLAVSRRRLRRCRADELDL